MLTVLCFEIRIEFGRLRIFGKPVDNGESYNSRGGKVMFFSIVEMNMPNYIRVSETSARDYTAVMLGDWAMFSCDFVIYVGY